MDWMSWKTWTTIGLIIVALFAIYTFAATQSSHARDDAAITTRPPTASASSPLRGCTRSGVDLMDSISVRPSEPKSS